MRYIIKGPKNDETFEPFVEEINNAIATANSISVFPRPGVLEEMLLSRGVEVEIEINGLDTSDETIAVIHRKSSGGQ